MTPTEVDFEWFLVLGKKASVTRSFSLVALGCCVSDVTTKTSRSSEWWSALMNSESSYWHKVRREFVSSLQKWNKIMRCLMLYSDKPSFGLAEKHDKDVHTISEFYMLNRKAMEGMQRWHRITLSGEVTTFLEDLKWYDYPQAATKMVEKFPDHFQASSRPQVCALGELESCLWRLMSTTRRAQRLCKRRRITNKEHNNDDDVCPIVFQRQCISKGTFHFSVQWDDRTGEGTVTIDEWATLMAEESVRGEMARQAMSNEVKNTGFDAVFFETKGTTSATAAMDPFEFVILDSPSLAKKWQDGADPTAFAEHFAAAADDNDDSMHAVWFDNLGHDALLVCPRPLSTLDAVRSPITYAHVMPFVKHAPPALVSALWRAVGRQYRQAWQQHQAVWLSTSGEGVAWLHFRLDTQPKYIQYAAFANAERVKATTTTTNHYSRQTKTVPTTKKKNRRCCCLRKKKNPKTCVSMRW